MAALPVCAQTSQNERSPGPAFHCPLHPKKYNKYMWAHIELDLKTFNTYCLESFVFVLARFRLKGDLAQALGRLSLKSNSERS